VLVIVAVAVLARVGSDATREGVPA
jgi:hypothetical protein